jgi:hypothetical protein
MLRNESERHPEFKASQQLRDELALHAHLFTLELKEDWEALEQRYYQLQHLLQAKLAPRHLKKDVLLHDADAIAKSLITAYRRIRSQLEVRV